VLESLGRMIYRNRRVTLVVTSLLLALAIAVLTRGGQLTTGVIHGLEAERADVLAAQVLGHPPDNTIVTIFRSATLDPRKREFRAAMDAALAPLRKDPRVAAVTMPEELPGSVMESMTNVHARSVVTFVTLKGDFKEALGAYRGVRSALHGGPLEVTCTGKLAFTSDLDHTLEHDLLRAELFSIPITLLVILFVFRTMTAAVLPVGTGALAVAGGIAVVLGLSRVMDIAQYTVNVCSLVGLGVAIDYSLFVVARYREELAAGHGYEDAIGRTMATAGRVVLFSGLAVTTGLAGLFFFHGSYLFAMGLGGAIVVALAVTAALTFLPALLAILGPRIDAGKVRARGAAAGSGASGAPAAPQAPDSPEAHGRWATLAHAVMRRPIAFLVGTLVPLLLFAAPVFHMKTAAADVRVLAHTIEARRGYDQLREDFAELARTRITLAVEFPSAPALTRDRIAALFDLSRRIAKLPGVVKVDSLVDGSPDTGKEDYQDILIDPPDMVKPIIDQAKKLLVGDRVVLLYVSTDAAPDTEAARGLVRELRRAPAVGDGTLVVGGQSAHDIDTARFIGERTPRAVGFVVAVTFVVLFVLLGSVVLPIKAVLMNFMSIAASFGAIVWVFQDGHLFVTSGRPLEPALPVVLFCALFGLSMDYEVLILSRVKESYDRSGDNTAAVADGLEKTAGLVTSAAAVMVVVFAAFSSASVVVLSAVGFGMALAVAIDATLVRILLVPATMRLFGHLNWWAPRPLAALRDRLMHARGGGEGPPRA
jgi:RND superfamily putative drug exporter